MSTLVRLTARKILDSKGEWSVEATAADDRGHTVVASVPHGESRGSHEAVALDADVAVRSISDRIAPALLRADPSDQEHVDRCLVELDGTPNKGRLGGNATLAVSLACARLGAQGRGVPLWQYLRDITSRSVRHSAPPRLFTLFVEGGLHAGGGPPFQEYLLMPRAATMPEAVEIATTLYRAFQAWVVERFGPAAARLGDEGAFSPPFTDDAAPFAALAAAAERVGLRNRYDVGLDAAANNVARQPHELTVVYRRLRSEHRLAYLEDPFSEEDFTSFARLRAEFGDDVAVAGDDLTVTNVGRMELARAAGSVNATIIKPNQIGTLTETLAAVRRARDFGWQVVVSHRGQETNDDFIADLAVGIGADGLKLGAPARGERVAKYNRLLAIAAEQADGAWGQPALRRAP